MRLATFLAMTVATLRRRPGGRRDLRVHAQGPAACRAAARRTSPSSCAIARAPSRAARSATPTCSPGASSAATSSTSPAASSASATSCRSSCARSAARPPATPTRPRSCPSPTATSTSSTASSSTSRARSTTPACKALLAALLDDARAARAVAPRAVHAQRPPRLPRRPARAHGRRRDARARGLPAAPAPGLRPAVTAALVHDLGKTREFTYGAEIGLTEAGRLLGHVELGLALLRDRAARSTARQRAASSRSRTACCTTTAPDAAPGRRFGSAEALALHRLNALDASVKEALEHGHRGSGRRPRSRSARRTSCAATNRISSAKPTSSARSRHGVGDHDAAARRRRPRAAPSVDARAQSTLP